MSNEELPEGPTDSLIQREIDRCADERNKQYTSVRVHQLVPVELVYAFLIVLLLGLCIALWTVKTVSKYGAQRYENAPLWSLSAPPKASLDFLPQEKKLRQRLLQAASKPGEGYVKAVLSLGDLYLANNHTDLAQKCFEDALKSANVYKPGPATEIAVFADLGRADLAAGKASQAIPWLEKAISQCHQSDLENTIESKRGRIKLLEDLVEAYADTNDLEAAKKTCIVLLHLLHDQELATTEDRTLWLCQVADIERRMGNYDDAEKLFRTAISDLSPDSRADAARARFGIALIRSRKGDASEANRNYTLALLAAEQSEPTHSPLLSAIKQAYAYSLWKSNWIAACAMTFSSSSQDSVSSHEKSKTRAESERR